MLLHAFLGFALGSAGAEAHRGKWSGWQGCSSTGGCPGRVQLWPKGGGAALADTLTASEPSASSGAVWGAPLCHQNTAPARSASKPMVILHLLVGPAVFCFCTIGFFLPPVQHISVLHPLWPSSYCNSNLIQDHGTCTHPKQSSMSTSNKHKRAPGCLCFYPSLVKI